MSSTMVTDGDASSSRLSSETSESIFIDKSIETDVVDVNLSDESVSATSSVTRVPTTTLSGDDAFLQYLGNKFGNYSTRTKNTIQFQINRILYKADMGDFEKAPPKSEIV